MQLLAVYLRGDGVISLIRVNLRSNLVEKELEQMNRVNCILKIDSTKTEDIYMDIPSLQTGLIYLKKQIVGDIFTRSSETRRYIASLKQLSDNLMADDKCIIRIQTLLKEMDSKAESMTIDEKATELYHDGFRYVSKSVWKEKVRDIEHPQEPTNKKTNKLSKAQKRNLRKVKKENSN